MEQATIPTPAPAETSAATLRAAGLKKTFRMGDSDVAVLRGVDLTVRHGEFVAIEGRSGSGKSTLLHILGALEGVDAGRVEFNQHDYTRFTRASNSWIVNIALSKLFVNGAWIALLLGLVGWFAGASWFPKTPAVAHTAAVLSGTAAAALILSLGILVVHTLLKWIAELRTARLRNRDFGFVFQFYHLLPELNVLENTLVAAMVENSWARFLSRRRELRERAIDVLTQLGMAHRLKHRPAQLSGGERQRVAIARALMNSPRVLFADEPTGNLDVETGRQIMGVLEKLHRERSQTIVMVTHDRAIARQADRILVLKEGKLERAES